MTIIILLIVVHVILLEAVSVVILLAILCVCVCVRHKLEFVAVTQSLCGCTADSCVRVTVLLIAAYMILFVECVCVHACFIAAMYLIVLGRLCIFTTYVVINIVTSTSTYNLQMVLWVCYQ